MSELLTEDRGGVRVLTMNRPDKRNALNHALTQALLTALHAAEADEGVRSIVLTGAGPAFCAGAGEHDAAHAFVGFRGVQCGEQSLRERVIECVAFVGPVHGEDAHTSSIFG